MNYTNKQKVKTNKYNKIIIFQQKNINIILIIIKIEYSIQTMKWLLKYNM